MLSRCLNPGCKATFRYLSSGHIFTVEHPLTRPDELNTERRIEHYWLCGPCNRLLKVVIENGVATTVPAHPKLMSGRGAKSARQHPVV